MKKITNILLFILFCNLKSFGQVTISSLIVNNVSVNSTTPVNIHPSAITTISLSTEVKFTSPQDDSGTIKIYYQKNKTSPIITANGGNGGNLLFNGGTSTTRNFTITLDPAQFDPSGGYFYSEYKTSSDVVYKSTNIPILKIIPNTNPIPPSDPNYASQTVPYGGIPLLPDFVINNPNVQSLYWVDNNYNNILPDITNGNRLFKSIYLFQKINLIDGTSHIERQRMSVTVSRFLPDLANLTVNNTISSDMYIPVGQTPNTLIGNQATETHTIAGSRTQITNPLNNYQWQSRIIYPFWWENFDYELSLYGWKDISGATQQNYSPPAPTRGIEYRRLILEKPNDNSTYRNCAASNVITIYPLDNNTNIINTICCDQIVNYSATPSIITGSSIHGSIVYKWQSSATGIDGYYNLNGKDCTPARPWPQRGQSTYVGTIKYRRLVLDYDTNLYSLSNETTIVYSSFSGKNNNKKEQIDMINNSTTIYPNPSNSIITIDGIDKIASYKIKIIDATGRTVLSNNSKSSNNESFEIDISTLTNGIYVLELENETNKFTKKIIKN